MANIVARLVPPPTPPPPPPRVKLELDLSVDEAVWLRELCGSIAGHSVVRDFTTQLFHAIEDQLVDLPDYQKRVSQHAFEGELRFRPWR